MPELPEVEVTRRGLAPAMVGKIVTGAVVRVPKLRSPVPDLAECLSGKKLVSLRRRAKYLVWTFEGNDGKRAWLVTHMGMSGSWRIWPAPAPEPHRHDHIDIDFGDAVLRYTDPRRFGDFRWFETDPDDEEPLRSLGKEPWDEAVTPSWFLSELKKTSRPVKEVLLSGKIVVGCGNIYASGRRDAPTGFPRNALRSFLPPSGTCSQRQSLRAARRCTTSTDPRARPGGSRSRARSMDGKAKTARHAAGRSKESSRAGGRPSSVRTASGDFPPDP